MKHTIILILFLFLSGANFCWAFPVLQEAIESARLRQLNEVAIAKYQQPDRLPYISQLLKEARGSHSIEYEANALFLLCKHYYSINKDSMFYWSKQAIPLFMAEKRYDDLFRVKAWYIYNLTREKRDKEVLDSINTLKQLALDLHFPDGTDMANQALANYYLSNGLVDEGVALFEKVLAGMDKRQAPLVKRVNIIRELQKSSPDVNMRLMYLDRLKGYIDECEKEGVLELDEENPISALKYFLYRNYAINFIKLKQLPKAWDYLKKTEAIVTDYNVGHKDSEIKAIYAMYYTHIGEYDKSLQMYDLLLVDFDRRKMLAAYIGALRNKANVLMSAERYPEAAQLFKQYSAMNDSLSSAAYYKNLAEMKTQLNMDNLELANKQMEMEALKNHNQLLYLWGGMIVLTIICCMLVGLVYTVHRFSRRLKVAKEKAEEADQMKSAFLANMNHEIRTPLNAIVGFSQILIDEEDHVARQEFFNIIQSNNELLQRLIVDVLDISKIESNTMTVHYFVHDLPALMKEIYETIQLRMPAEVKLELAECESFQFNTDRNRLMQILTNLLTNAIKHTHKGFICFGYELSDTTVRFYVQDTGEGIPQEQMERIFSRFVQLDEWNKGVGLGLAICKGLVTKMRGSIDVTSTLGEGSVFSVVLPLK